MSLPSNVWITHICHNCRGKPFNLNNNCLSPLCDYYVPTCMVLKCQNKVVDGSSICLECKTIESMLRHERQLCVRRLRDIKQELKEWAIVSSIRQSLENNATH